MSGFVRATGWIARAHLRRVLSSRRTLVVLLVAFLPTLVAYVVGRSPRAAPSDLAVGLSWVLVLQIVVPLTALIFGSAVIAEEVEDRTISYLFTRPIPRASVLWGRYLSSVTWLVVVLLAATGALLAVAAQASGEGEALSTTAVWRIEIAVGASALVYLAIFTCLGAFFRHPILVGIGYAFVIEGFLANLPGRTQVVTVQYHVRSLIAESTLLEMRRVDEIEFLRTESSATAALVLAGIALGALLLGSWRVARREFELTS